MTHEDEPLEPKSLEPKTHEPAGLDEDAPFDDFESGGGFRAAIDKNPALKIGLIVGAIILVVLALTMFGKTKTQAPTSLMAAKSTVSSLPSAGPISPAYKRAVEDQNAQNVDKALKTGGDTIPVSTAQSVSPVPAIPTGQAQEDPLERWRRIESDRAKQDQTQAAALPQTQADPNAQAIKELAGAMSQQMQSVLSSVKPVVQQHADVTKIETNKDKTGSGTGASGSESTNGTNTPKDVTIYEPAGSIAYAQLITEANSDVKGPVLAQIVGGPLAGDRILGTFNVQNNEFLVLKFDTVIIDGVGHSTEAYAVDPATNLTGLVTDIDHRYFQRVVVPAAASFIQGMGAAIAATGSTVNQSSSSTVVTTPKLNTKQQVFAGISTASQKAGSVIDQDAGQLQVLVTVAAGTPMGILFMQPVTDEQTNGK